MPNNTIPDVPHASYSKCECGSYYYCNAQCSLCQSHSNSCEAHIAVRAQSLTAIADIVQVQATPELCAHCAAVLTTDEVLINEQGHRICTRCTIRHTWSDIQEAYILSRNAIVLSDGNGYVSRDYARNNYYYDENTDYWFSSEDSLLEFRAEQRQQSNSSPYGYHATTPIDVHGWDINTPKTSLCFGVELEMEHVDSDDYDNDDSQTELVQALGGRDGRHGIATANGRYILMNDGSLNYTGVELITVPYTLEAHQKAFGWKDILSRVTRIGRSGKGTHSCGMHVHVNRAALSAFTLGKMLVFVNSPENTQLIEKIAQRNPEEWAKRYAKEVRDGANRESDKYEAMHLSPRTVEFRIFRGNLRFDRVLKNIEFCHAVTMYAKDTSMRDLEKPTLFIAWLSKHKGTYPNLAKFLSESAFVSRLNAAANAGSNARPSTTVRQSEEI